MKILCILGIFLLLEPEMVNGFNAWNDPVYYMKNVEKVQRNADRLSEMIRRERAINRQKIIQIRNYLMKLMKKQKINNNHHIL